MNDELSVRGPVVKNLVIQLLDAKAGSGVEIRNPTENCPQGASLETTDAEP